MYVKLIYVRIGDIFYTEEETYEWSIHESADGDRGGEDPGHVPYDHAAEDLKWSTGTVSYFDVENSFSRRHYRILAWKKGMQKF